MPMPTSKNNGNGHPVGSTMNTCANRCSSMLLPLAGVNMTVLSAGAGENHCPNETWGWNLTPWNFICPDSIQEDIKTSTRMYTNFRGYPGEANVRRLLKSSSMKGNS